MKACARVENLHISYRKANLVCGLIRNKKVNQALTILQNTNKKTARYLQKLLASAIANAINNHAMNADKLYVYEAIVGQARTIKRAMPRAKGSSNMIKKRHCHLTI
ncbi:50S ribosomal protein L22 [bacterium]|nr:50S ribosomal protein L22 [bacterium]